MAWPENLNDRLVAEVVGCTGFYVSFKEAFGSVWKALADNDYYLDDRAIDDRFESSGCTEAEGCISFAFSDESLVACNDLIEFEWYTSHTGPIKVTIRVIKGGCNV